MAASTDQTNWDNYCDTTKSNLSSPTSLEFFNTFVAREVAWDTVYIEIHNMGRQISRDELRGLAANAERAALEAQRQTILNRIDAAITALDSRQDVLIANGEWLKVSQSDEHWIENEIERLTAMREKFASGPATLKPLGETWPSDAEIPAELIEYHKLSYNARLEFWGEERMMAIVWPWLAPFRPALDINANLQYEPTKLYFSARFAVQCESLYTNVILAERTEAMVEARALRLGNSVVRSNKAPGKAVSLSCLLKLPLLTFQQKARHSTTMEEFTNVTMRCKRKTCVWMTLGNSSVRCVTSMMMLYSSPFLNGYPPDLHPSTSTDTMAVRPSPVSRLSLVEVATPLSPKTSSTYGVTTFHQVYDLSHTTPVNDGESRVTGPVIHSAV